MTKGKTGPKKAEAKKKPGTPKKATAPKKPAAKKPAAKKKAAKKQAGSGLGTWAPVAMLGIVVVAVLVMLGRDYQQLGVRQSVEEITGELDRAGVTLRVSDRAAAVKLLDDLERVTRNSLGALRMGQVARGQDSYTLEITLEETGYPITLRWGSGGDYGEIDMPPPPPGPPPVQGPVLAILIDDLGLDLERARGFIELDLELTPAILPFLRHSNDIAMLSMRQGRTHILHMPMEPGSYPVNDPGQGAIMVATEPEEAKTLLGAALASVPGVRGINNHMGSRATEVPVLMQSVMEELQLRGLFFVDSRTTADSVAATKAREQGLAWAGRDVFIDNILTTEAIEERLQKAIEIARQRGSAVAIGHGYEETLQVLTDWVGRFEAEGVTVVPVTTILHPAFR